MKKTILTVPITAYFKEGIALEMRIEAAKLNITRSRFLRLAAEKLLKEISNGEKFEVSRDEE